MGAEQDRRESGKASVTEQSEMPGSRTGACEHDYSLSKQKICSSVSVKRRFLLLSTAPEAMVAMDSVWQISNQLMSQWLGCCDGTGHTKTHT
jgi:hypothetical protein